MPSFDIKGKKGLKETRHVSDGKKINHSFFGVMLNTNYKPKYRDEVKMMADEYPQILEDLLKNNDTLFQKSIVIVDKIENAGGGKKHFEGHTISPAQYEADIKHIRSRFQSEIGHTGGKFHLHASFFVVHTTKIQMNMKPMVDAFNKELEARGLHTIKYFHVKAEKASTDLYMTKYDYQ
jgi:hypothetical protein